LIYIAIQKVKKILAKLLHFRLNANFSCIKNKCFEFKMKKLNWLSYLSLVLDICPCEKPWL